MSPWNGRTADGRFAAVIQSQALGEMDRLCSASGALETGGILVGQYSPDLATALIFEATAPPPDSDAGATWFRRGIDGLRDLLRRRWRAKERTHYLGEWHFHPANHVDPSRDDFEQMTKIACAAVYNCTEPLLVILGASRDSEGVRVLRVFVCVAGTEPVELYFHKPKDTKPLSFSK